MLHPLVTRWLYFVAGITFLLIVFGGFVRLTRSGLSIVEWNPVMGVVPPIGDDAWRAEFAKYQATPEFRTVNADMTLEGYRRIFYIEWAHRLIARLAGLAVVIPLAAFVWRGIIPWRRSGLFVAIALLFGLQGFLGWFMVSSGLLDQPSVSHYRLTIHLLTALSLLALTTWAAMTGDRRLAPTGRQPGTTASRLAWLLLIVVTLQIAYGGLVAGLKAGHVSYSWPLMGGAFVPAGLFASAGSSLWATLTASAPTVHWIHRWFAFVVLAVAALLLATSRRQTASPAARRAVDVVAALVALQIALGVSVLWFQVTIALALSHQALGLGVFTATLVATHRLQRGA